MARRRRARPRAPSIGHPGVEGVERTGHLDRAEGGLDEQAPDMALAGMADVTGVGRPAAALRRGADPAARPGRPPRLPDGDLGVLADVESNAPHGALRPFI